MKLIMTFCFIIVMLYLHLDIYSNEQEENLSNSTQIYSFSRLSTLTSINIINAQGTYSNQYFTFCYLTTIDIISYEWNWGKT